MKILQPPVSTQIYLFLQKMYNFYTAVDIQKFFKSCEKVTGENILHSTDLINAFDTENLISKSKTYQIRK